MSGAYQANCLIGLPLRDPKSQLPMLLAKLGHGLGKDRPRGRREPGDLQIADNTIAFPVELALRALHLRKNRVRPPRQQGASRRQSYAAAIRLDEPLAYIALQLAKLLRYGRRGQVQRRSRAGYRAKGRQRVEGLETLKV